MKGLFKIQGSRLEPTGANMAEMKSFCDEASASTARCCKKLLQMQNYLATAFEKMKICFGRAVAMTKVPDAVPTQYKILHLGREQPVSFANVKMARLEMEVVKVTQKRDEFVTKAVQLTIGVHVLD